MRTRVVSCVRLPGAVLAMLMMFFANGAHAQSPIVINEIMADNGTALDNAGDFPDWIELLNITGAPVDLADWSLTDAPTLPRRFVFPAGTVIPANGFLLIYCDDRTNSPGLHTGFGLSDKGETLALFTASRSVCCSPIRSSSDFNCETARLAASLISPAPSP